MKLKIRVPATTANLRPGFDCLGLALDLWNTIEIETIDRGLEEEVDCPEGVDIPRNRGNPVVYGMDAVFHSAKRKRPPCRIRVTTRIPIARAMMHAAMRMGLRGSTQIVSVSPKGALYRSLGQRPRKNIAANKKS
jgi:homoserine kinase